MYIANIRGCSFRVLYVLPLLLVVARWANFLGEQIRVNARPDPQSELVKGGRC